ncbi:hypothetical protein H9P43_009454 [Blastocladiella emersonii ATCC 22665]|nr:hypothetical protein H9P43_009437 [Blastocladiella emersonii ATCC 22665]KAI9152658.1 hypothetical protein H9P43_009454 [Blastocladiella emersonii ATCC 22665]
MLVFVVVVGLATVALVARFLLAPKRLDWDTQLALLTGGSHGVGLATAKRLLAKSPSLRLVVVDREPPEEDWVPESDAHRVDLVTCDLAGSAGMNAEQQHAHLAALVDRVIAKHGVPTILINNAGVVSGKYLTDLVPADVDRTLAVNLRAPMFLTQLLLPHWIAADAGHVLHVGSAAGLVGLAWLTDYCASKFALLGFHESLRQELRHTNVKTSIVCPSHIRTRLFASVTVPFQFLCPSLEPDYVARAIVDTLDRNASQDVWLPLFTWTSLIVRAAPIWLNDFGHWFMDTNHFLLESKAPPHGQRSWAKSRAKKLD